MVSVVLARHIAHSPYLSGRPMGTQETALYYAKADVGPFNIVLPTLTGSNSPVRVFPELPGDAGDCILDVFACKADAVHH